MDPPDLSDRNLEMVDPSQTMVDFYRTVSYRCKESLDGVQLWLEKDHTLTEVALTCLNNGSFSVPPDDYNCLESNDCNILFFKIEKTTLNY